MKYRIEKDSYLDCWIVWEVHLNYCIDIFHGKTKKECREFIEKESKEI